MYVGICIVAIVSYDADCFGFFRIFFFFSFSIQLHECMYVCVHVYDSHLEQNEKKNERMEKMLKNYK